MAHDVFVSYSARNKTIADAVCAALEAEGIRCWIAPRDVVPSMEYAEAIVDAIEQARIMVLVFTADANAAPQVRREVERAANHDTAILPVRFENVVPARALAFFIGNVHWLDALTPPLEPHLKKLADTIKKRLEAVSRRKAPTAEPSAAEASQDPNRQEPAAAPLAASRPPETLPQQAPAESPHVKQPIEIGRVARLESAEQSSTRRLGEWRSRSGTVAAPRTWRIPVWVWGGGAVLTLVLVGVFAASRFGRHSAAEGFDDKPLADTMKYIQDGLNAIGKLEIAVNFKNTSNGSNFRYTEADEASNVVADPSQCRISYHWKVWQNGSPQPTSDHDSGFNLRDVDDVVLEPWRKWRTDSFANTSSSNLVAISTDPDVTALVLSWKNKATPYDFPFTDALLAIHLADAFKHAVKLCGGGSAANAPQGAATTHTEAPVQPGAQPARQNAAAPPATVSPSTVRKPLKDTAGGPEKQPSQEGAATPTQAPPQNGAQPAVRSNLWVGLHRMRSAQSSAPSMPNNAPKPLADPGETASLDDTMKFIQDKLAGVGRIDFIQSVPRSDGATIQYPYAEEASNVTADPRQCRVSYRFRKWFLGSTQPKYDEEIQLDLRDLDDIVVEPMMHPEYLNYPRTNLSVVRKGESPKPLFFPFIDAGLANRVASALKHAAKLCGGGASGK